MSTLHHPDQLAQEFIIHAVENDILRFGAFKTKAGRISPYFFNAGHYNDGQKLCILAQLYARRLLASTLTFDMIFGPAYKGITLAAAVAIELSRLGKNVPYAYNRKEEKDHGEGGTLVGAPVQGRILIIDDVISAGTSVRESIQMIRQAGGIPCGVSIALDRQEKATSVLADGTVQDELHSAVQYITHTLDLPVVAIATLDDLLQYLNSANAQAFSQHYESVLNYRERYGVS